MKFCAGSDRHLRPLRVTDAHPFEPARPVLAVHGALAAAERAGQLAHVPTGRVAPPLRAGVVARDAGGLLHNVADQAGRRVGRLVDVPDQRRVDVVLPVRRAPGRVPVEPLLQLVPHVEVEVRPGAQREDRAVGHRLGLDESPHQRGVLHAPLGLGHLLGQLALRADGEVLHLAHRVDLAHRNHRDVAAAQLPVDVGAEGADLNELEVESHFAEPHHAGAHDGRELPGQQHNAGTAQRLRREVRCMGLQLGQCLLGTHGGLPAGLEPCVEVGQRLGQHAADRGGVLDRRDLGVGGAAALELGHDQAAVGPEAQHRDAIAVGATGRREPVELEGDDLDGGAEDGGIGQHPLLQIGALLQARFLERDHLRWQRDGASDGEEHFFRHFSVQARANGCFQGCTESHTKTQRNIKTRGQTRVGRQGRSVGQPPCGVGCDAWPPALTTRSAPPLPRRKVADVPGNRAGIVQTV